MPSRTATADYAIDIFRATAKRHGAGPDRAWLGIYAALLWYETTGRLDRPWLPHIIDADKLRRPKEGALGAWQTRAVKVEEYLAQQMGCEPSAVRSRLDQLMRRREYARLQRQNPLGIAFLGLVWHALRTFGDEALTYETEQPAQRAFPGIGFPGRSTTPSMDVLIRKHNRPRAIVSAKWSLRHDRINDLTNECPAYKQAASWGRHPFDFIVVTNEFDPARLGKLLDDTCIDAVVHVHKAVVMEVCGLNGRLNAILDLPELFVRTRSL